MKFRIIAVALGVLLMVVGFELSLRVLDRPSQRIPDELQPSPRVRAYVQTLPVAEGVERSWFDVLPAPLARGPLAPELAAVAIQARSMSHGSELFKRWNPRYIQESVCSGKPFFRAFPGFGFVFEPLEPGSHPRYRYLPDLTSPYGLVTNHFGFRGPSIAAEKPAQTIRIAFVGASTTVGSHGLAYSYPEFIEPWLNRWVRTQMPGVRVEIINAGREGISSSDIAAIVRQEVMPLEPDLIVYYEGSNQFVFQELLDQGPRAQRPPPNLDGPWLAGTSRFVLLRRLDIVLRRVGRAGAEPRKPASRLRWPSAVDEHHPDPDSAALPLELPGIVRDLDDIHEHARSAGAQLAVSSFVWLVHPGLVVDPANQGGIVQMLNSVNWPATYEEIRRMADFQNRGLQAYAAARGLPFFDIAASFPQDPSLFTDAIHFQQDGERLHAWLAFQAIVPMLREAIAAGRLPRPDQGPYRGPRPPDKIERSDLQCDSYRHFSQVAVPVTDLQANVPDGASATGGIPKRIMTPAGRNAYAAEMKIAPDVRTRDGGGLVHWRMHVRSGRIAAGVLTPDRSRFVNYRTLDADALPADLYLEVSALADAGWLVIANASPYDDERSEVDVEAITLLVPAAGTHR